MTDLRIIPADPRDQARDRYRTLASEDRLPSPLSFDPRPKPRSILRALKGLAGLLAFTTIVFTIWSGINVG